MNDPKLKRLGVFRFGSEKRGSLNVGFNCPGLLRLPVICGRMLTE
jgi:hypothetical protein